MGEESCGQRGSSLLVGRCAARSHSFCFHTRPKLPFRQYAVKCSLSCPVSVIAKPMVGNQLCPSDSALRLDNLSGCLVREASADQPARDNKTGQTDSLIN